MYLTYNGKPIEQTIPFSTIQCSSILHREHHHSPHSNDYLPCKVPKETLKASVGKNCLFEPSFKHRSNFVNCTTYEGTVDDSVVNSGTFKIIMTRRSNRHIKVHTHETRGMLKNCDEDQICTVHRIVTFEQTSQKGKEVKSDCKPVEKQIYHIPSRNKKTGLIEVKTLMKEEDVSPVTRINEKAQNKTL